MKNLLLLILIVMFSGLSLNTCAQKGYDFPDSVDYKKNVIKWNITPFLL